MEQVRYQITFIVRPAINVSKTNGQTETQLHYNITTLGWTYRQQLQVSDSDKHPERTDKEETEFYLPVDSPVIRKLSMESCVVIRHQQTWTLIENTHQVFLQMYVIKTKLHLFTYFHDVRSLVTNDAFSTSGHSYREGNDTVSSEVGHETLTTLGSDGQIGWRFLRTFISLELYINDKKYKW